MKIDPVIQLKTALWEETEVLYYGETDSTQTRARKAFTEDGPAERLILANAQTAGRGRSGKSFYAPKGTGLYLTFTLHLPERTPEDCLWLTTVAAVAVRRAILRVCGVSTEIKWVNDLYLHGKKVCGILTEALHETGWYLIGVGINLTTTTFPEELKEKAGTIFAQDDAGVAGTSDDLRLRLAAAIVREIKALGATGMTPEIFEEYRAHSLLIGREITFEQDGQVLRGTVQGLSETCGLYVRVAGQEVELTSGMILGFSAEKTPGL